MPLLFMYSSGILVAVGPPFLQWLAVALSVAGIAVTALAINALAAMQAPSEDSNTAPFNSASECGSGSGNGLGSGCSARLGPDVVDRSGCGGGKRLGWSDGNGLDSGSIGGDRLGSGASGGG